MSGSLQKVDSFQKERKFCCTFLSLAQCWAHGRKVTHLNQASSLVAFD